MTSKDDIFDSRIAFGAADEIRIPVRGNCSSQAIELLGTQIPLKAC